MDVTMHILKDDSAKLGVQRNMKKKLKFPSHTKTRKQHTMKSMKSIVGGSPPRKSRRISGEHPQITIEIGSSTQTTPVTDVKLRNAVKKIKHDIPQIVSLPVPPSRHAFLVHVQDDKIMISDWGGMDNLYRGVVKIKGKKNRDYESKWEQYSEIMHLLEQKFKLPIEYYPIDIELSELADEFHKSRPTAKEPDGSGGCSEYIYKWMDKHFP